MATTREELLDLIEETYGVKHPDFKSIHKQFRRITELTHNEKIESDTRLLIAGLKAAKNAYKDWDDLNDYQRDMALGAMERIRNLTRSTLKKYDVSVG